MLNVIFVKIFSSLCRQGDTKIQFLGGRGARLCIRVHSMGVLGYIPCLRVALAEVAQDYLGVPQG